MQVCVGSPTASNMFGSCVLFKHPELAKLWFVILGHAAMPCAIGVNLDVSFTHHGEGRLTFQVFLQVFESLSRVQR